MESWNWWDLVALKVLTAMNNKNPKTHKKAIKIEHSRILYKKEY